MPWMLPNTVHPDADALARALDLPPLIGRLLAQRGHTTPAAARRFLNGTLAELPHPFLPKDMDVALPPLVRVLPRPGAAGVTHAPRRVKEGYGFSERGGVFAKGQGASVLVAVGSG